MKKPIKKVSKKVTMSQVKSGVKQGAKLIGNTAKAFGRNMVGGDARAILKSKKGKKSVKKTVKKGKK